MESLKRTEKETLTTFQKHRPSEYFSHIGSHDSFLVHHRKVENLYRFGLNLPPEFFKEKKVIDLGAGTGENTISLAKWGASCTLVEMNSEAIERARKVFAEKLELNPLQEHSFICQSLFDIDLNLLQASFDISHSRGVFTHVADKTGAFKILSDLAKPGGYIIYGDRNTSGGVQEMLQRFAIYSLAKNLPMKTFDERVIYLAEALFEKDIDRSQASVPRTREAIIFDRWVISQQDDPSVSDVLAMMRSNGLQYVSSWPRIDFAGRGESTYTSPINWNNLENGAKTIELMWMLLNHGESENLESFIPQVGAEEFFNHTTKVSNRLRNLKNASNLSGKVISEDFVNWGKLGKLTFESQPNIAQRLKIFAMEVGVFLSSVEQEKPLGEIRKLVDSFEILFQNFAGVRHVDYLAYKPESNE